LNKLEKRKGIKITLGPPKLTRYEKARIIGARALQLALGAPPLVDIEELGVKDPIEIARIELEMGVLPIIIRRKLPGGEFQDIPLKYLL